MSNVIITPNMNLPNPVPSVDPGPDYANNLSNSLSIVDVHTHIPGQGIQIPPDGLDINSDLTFQNNNATDLRSTRFQAQPSALAGAADLGSLYVVGVDLFYNDKSGNQIRITSGGSVNAGSGSISGLPSGTASASFGGGTFVFQSATSTSANIDVGSVILRNNTINSKGLTLQPPSAMAANYSVTLPAIPGGTSFLSIDTSGNISGSIATAGGITGSNIAATTITGSNIASATITQGNMAPGSDSEIYLESGNGYGSINTTVRRYSTVVNSVGSDLTLVQSSTLGDSITAVTGGLYCVTICDSKSGGGSDYGATVNSALLSTSIDSISYANGRRLIGSAGNSEFNTISRIIRFAASDIIRVQTDGTPNNTSASQSYFIVTKVGT